METKNDNVAASLNEKRVTVELDKLIAAIAHDNSVVEELKPHRKQEE